MQTENLFTTDCIRTFTGKYVNVFEPVPDMICIEDIAHALSNMPRFGGHLPQFYSVAQHSCRCAAIVPSKLRLAALLHDASEAYLMDIPRPIKVRLTNYKEIEDRLMVLIADKFGFTYPLHRMIKEVDQTVLKNEWECLMLGNNNSIHPYAPAQAKEFFLDWFKIYSV